MSPVSRKRKRRKGGRAPLRAVPARPPVQGGGIEGGARRMRTAPAAPPPALAEMMAEMTEGILASAESLLEVEDPLEAQLAAATLVGIGAAEPEAFETALVEVFVPAYESAGTPGALAFLLALASVAPRRAARAAQAAADRLAAPDLLHPDGIRAPAWAADLREPLTVTDTCRLSDPEQTASILAARFHRAGRAHSVAVAVDDADCGAAAAILPIDDGEMAGALAELEAAARAEGIEFARQELTAAQFRWWAEQALDARAAHDEDEQGLDEEGPDEIPYGVLAALLRAHLRALPPAKAPRGTVPAGHGRAAPELPSLQALAQLLAPGPGFAAGPPGRTSAPRRDAPPKLAPKRKRSAGPAPIYQLKVALRGAKPPIWRRLEVPADIGLADLHHVLQTAFGWYDCHLHEFATPHGRFGPPEPDPIFGERARPESSATLEQVAPGAGTKLRYTYDFGDGWEHELVVEKVLDPVPGISYPRCTAGRRAGPPEDCGGVWGYQDLLAILADPEDKEHTEKLDWLGLADASEFDPDAFHAAEITTALADLR